MNSLKVCVYAICKNESKFIDRWINATSEADHIVVLDTGSSDNSVAKLKAHNIDVHETSIVPWRFDTARNAALSLIPNDIDICVSLDMDEVILPGWYQDLMTHWTTEVSAAKCRFVWHFTEDGKEDGVFWPIRIHSKKDYTWTHSIHEVLTYMGTTPTNIITLPCMQINHYPDATKPRDYLNLLETSVAANPYDSRDHFYLGREYMYHGLWKKCIHTLNIYLSLPSSTWNEERCGALRFIARAYLNLNQTSKAIDSLRGAINEAPFLREPYIDLAFIYYKNENWSETLKLIQYALLINKPSQTFINEGNAWDSVPYDLASIAYFNLGNYEQSLIAAQKALELAPNNTRIAQNIASIKYYIQSST